VWKEEVQDEPVGDLQGGTEEEEEEIKWQKKEKHIV